jgi:hypothetical protein
MFRTVDTSVHASANATAVRVPTNPQTIATMLIISTGATAPIIRTIKTVAESVIYGRATRVPKVHAILQARISLTKGIYKPKFQPPHT